MVPPILYLPTAFGAFLTFVGINGLINPSGFHKGMGLPEPSPTDKGQNQIMIPLITVRTAILGVMLLYTTIAGQVKVTSNIMMIGSLVSLMDGYVVGKYGVKGGWISHLVGSVFYAGYGWWLGM